VCLETKICTGNGKVVEERDVGANVKSTGTQPFQLLDRIWSARILIDDGDNDFGCVDVVDGSEGYLLLIPSLVLVNSFSVTWVSSVIIVLWWCGFVVVETPSPSLDEHPGLGRGVCGFLFVSCVISYSGLRGSQKTNSTGSYLTPNRSRDMLVGYEATATASLEILVDKEERCWGFSAVV
jgi:hypothetical protein